MGIWQVLTAVRWSPYVVGVGIGILSWLTLLVSKHTLGCSTSYARTAGMIEALVRGERAKQRAYYQKVTPAIDWQWMLVVGMAIGAFIAANLSGDFALRWVPDRWAAAFGAAVLPRLIVALLGGIFLGFGARWAEGCTSGHGISGAMQLSIASWISVAGFFAGGIITAYIVYGLF